MIQALLNLSAVLTGVFIRVSMLYFYYPEVVDQLLRKGGFVNPAHVLALTLYISLLFGSEQLIQTARIAAVDPDVREFANNNYGAVSLVTYLVSGIMLWLMTAMF